MDNVEIRDEQQQPSALRETHQQYNETNSEPTISSSNDETIYNNDLDYRNNHRRHHHQHHHHHHHNQQHYQTNNEGSYCNIDRLLQSRYNIVSLAGSRGFAAISDESGSLNDVIVDNITESEPTSAMLIFCKKWFLLPYVNLLGLAGLRPITIDAPDWISWLGHIQTAFIIIILLTGYFLQYLSSFRRDRGIRFNNSDGHYITNSPTTTSTSSSSVAESAQLHLILSTNDSGSTDSGNIEIVDDFNTNSPVWQIGETTFVYAIPSILHFSAYLFAIYVFRIADNEYLQNLVERIFIVFQRPIKLLLIMWCYLLAGVIWLAFMILCLKYEEVHLNKNRLAIKWFGTSDDEKNIWLKYLLLITVATHDFIQMIILTSYAIQCYLLRSYLCMLKDKLLQNTIDPLNWMREMCEFQKLLHHLNKKIAIPVCFFTILNLIYTFSGIIYAIRRYSLTIWLDVPIKVFSLNAGILFLWLLLALFPFFQAAALTLDCYAIQSSGHQIRIRPFVHRNTSSEELNSVLLYASSLKMSAKLFRMPIQGNYLCFVILCLLVLILTLGMCVNVALGFN